MVFLTRLCLKRPKYHNFVKSTSYINPLNKRQLRAQFPNKKPEGAPMKGLMGVKYPITMTTNYLKEGIELRDSIKCVTIHYR